MFITLIRPNKCFQAHGVKGVLSMKANSKQDQLISAGKGKVKTLNGSDKFIFVSYIGQCSGT